MSIRVISFGFLHSDPPPEAHITVDVRTHFRDPHVSAKMRTLTSASHTVREHVLATPGVAALVDGTVTVAAAMAAGPSGADVTVAVGCAGGRHRAPTIAQEVADRLAATGLPTVHERLHEHEPVVHR